MTALFDPATLAAYVAAAAALVVAPGPAQALVLSRTLERGWSGGVLTSLGLNVATLTHAMLAALGLSAILTAWPIAYIAITLAGALYLVWLGVRMLAGGGTAAATTTSSAGGAQGDRRLFLHAIVTGLLNPKVAVFFLAFLPQFVDPGRGQVVLQFLALGAILATLGFVGDSLIAVAAGAARERLLADARFALWRRRVTGSVLIAVGLWLALGGR